MTQAVIYTDLDGTLLDHHTYELGVAGPVLSEVLARGIPVIPVTSKTHAEVQLLCQNLKLNGPFVVENGAAIWVPKTWGLLRPTGSASASGYWCHVLGKSRGYIRGLMAGLGGEWSSRFHALSDMSSRQVCAVTGLDEPSARRAQARHYSETLLWLGSAVDRIVFAQAVAELGLQVVQGGRFLHVLAGGGKGTAMRWLHEHICSDLHPDAISIAAGDAHNDLQLLEAADHALVVRSPLHEPPKPHNHPRLYLSTEEGPAGWAEGIQSIFEIIDKEKGYGRFLSERQHYYAAQSG
ncbi:MAG: HAD-IIB family hydrolase [Luminiphilus sp.]|nr:HAD-IIB family hydrolase [Luminiphilus sp.]